MKLNLFAFLKNTSCVWLLNLEIYNHGVTHQNCEFPYAGKINWVSLLWLGCLWPQFLMFRYMAAAVASSSFFFDPMKIKKKKKMEISRITNLKWKFPNEKSWIKSVKSNILKTIWNEESRMKVLELKMVKENSQLNNLKWKILYGMYESRACALEFNTGIRKKTRIR